MATVQKTTKKTAKATTDRAAGTKRTSTKKDVSTSLLRDEWRGAGAALAKLFEKSGKDEQAKVGATLASKLAEGTASNADLIKLRDASNETAARLREAKQADTAKQFSEHNYMVRRAERATRGRG